MAPKYSLLLLLCIAIMILTTKCQTYPFSTWMEDWSSNDATTFLNGNRINGSTIFDIVLPGAHKAGMSFLSSDTTSKTSPSDSYKLVLNSLNSMEAKQKWAERQKGSILQLLMNGIRFLDLEFEHDATTDTYYSHNGLLGKTSTEIFDDIETFLTNTGKQEIILIYLHDFLGSNINFESSQLGVLMDSIISDTYIESKLAKSSVDNINSRSIGDLINMDGIQIIIFTDEYPSATYNNKHYFYDANTYLFMPDGNGNNGNSSATFGQLDEISEVRSFVISNIRYGWPDDRLNLIYWTLDIGSSFTEQHIYSSMQQFSSGVNNELNSVINTYPKLWFANIIIIDFVEITDIMEQILILNYRYFNCRDAIWGNNGTGCPSLTDLDSQYFRNDISPLCQINIELQNDTYCARSCGLCPARFSNEANPGDSCIDNTDCAGIVYDNNNGAGECFIRPNTERAIDNIKPESFCLSLNALESCTNYDVLDKCASGDGDGIDLSNCNEYCTSNWQCLDGYCNTEYSVCMTLLESSTTTAPPTSRGNQQRYNFIESDGAEAMLGDVAPFRPGDYKAAPSGEGVDCDSPGPDCLLDGMDANPYLASLLGFALIPFIMSIFLCFCYTVCCCPCWCLCDQCGKKCCCCHRVMKDPISDDNKIKQWVPCGLLGICLIIVIWACIEGIINNSEMHDHIFGDKQSVKYAINHLFDEVIDRFEAVEPTAEYIVDFGIGILNDVFDILSNNTNSVGGAMDDLYFALDIIAGNYSNGVNLTGTFINPFNASGGGEEFSIECPYCDAISDQATNIKTTLNGSIGQQLGKVDELINQTKGLVNAKDRIKNLTSVFFVTLNEVINTSHTIKSKSNEYIEIGAEYDEKYREQPAMIFFCIPMCLIIFVILGVFMKNKWCFKCEWFCAMYCCGIPIMLLSWPFIFFAVLWADLCVRLDDFEQNLGSSQIGELANLDNISSDSTPALGMALVNTCWYGGSPIELFNLSSILNWDTLREQLDDTLDVDITSLLETQDVSSFKTEIDTLSTDEFGSVVDSFIANANSLGSYCGCGQENTPFTRQNLYPQVAFCADYIINGTYNYSLPTVPAGTLPPGFTTTSSPFSSYSLTPYWLNLAINVDSGKCQTAYINASAAVQIEFSLKDEANRKINGIKADADRVFDVYDDIYGIATNLEKDISSISCLIEPLFDQFDIIIDNFTNCGFLGEAYGNFKEAGCVDLFDDWYKIARAMTIIAYISILIVFLSLCMDYIYGPVTKRQPSVIERHLSQEIEEDIAVDAAETELVTPYGAKPHFGTEEPTNYDPHRPSNYNNFDDAPASLAGSRAKASSVASYSSYQPQPAPPSGQPPVGSVPVVVVPVIAESSSNQQPKPIIAESEHQEYEIRYDNEPNANQLPIIQQEDEPNEPEEGGGATTNDNNYNEEAVVPTDDKNAVVLDDNADVALKDSSDEESDHL